MRKVLLFLIALFLPLAGVGQEYVVRYQPLSSGTIFHIETLEGERIGRVLREQLSGHVLYTFENCAGKLLASGKTHLNQAETVVSLIGSSGETLGKFHAEIYNLYPSEYKIYSPYPHQLIARGYMNWLGNAFSLTEPDYTKNHLVTFLRPRFKLFNDYWHFQVHQTGVIDLRLLCILGAFQTACDLKFEMM